MRTNTKNREFTKFRPMIRSRHPSHEVLRPRGVLERLNFRSVIRLGSTTDLEDTVTNGGARVECNTVQAVRNSSSKLLMKRKFSEFGVKTAEWWDSYQSLSQDDEIPYPIVAKHIFGSRGRGNTLIANREELDAWLVGKTLSNYIFEKFHNYNREYRLHVANGIGCFYTCRKMIKSDTPEDQRWFRNDSNSVWIVEENPDFDKPVNWNNVVEESVKALNSVGLDVGAVDLRIQSRTNSRGTVRDNPEFIIVEINSAPSFGDRTAEEYIKNLPIILKNKFNNAG